MNTIQRAHNVRVFRRLVPLALRGGARRVTTAQQVSAASGRLGAPWDLPTTGLPFVAGLSEAYGDWTL